MSALATNGSPSRGLEARPLGPGDRRAVLAHLSADPRANLLLIDHTERLGEPGVPGELPSEMVGAFRDGRLVAVASLRPSVVLDACAERGALDALLPWIETVGVGLVKSEAAAVEALWPQLSLRRRRRALVDRLETAYAVESAETLPAGRPPDLQVRRATRSDLDALVHAARESLREESRPDPFAGDVRGFRRWVRGRVPRARVVVQEGRVVFVGYADVRLRQGWLLQGVYTWPEVRRRGLARFGVSELCREAFGEGAAHVQLAVVEGNEAGRRLYESLGFRPFGRLRTILFS